MPYQLFDDAKIYPTKGIMQYILLYFFKKSCNTLIFRIVKIIVSGLRIENWLKEG